MKGLTLAFIASITLIIQGCTCSVNFVNASGQVSDVVDEAAETNAKVDAAW